MVELSDPAATTSYRQFPFAFAKQHNVFVSEWHKDYVLLHTCGGVPPQVFLECRRFCAKPLQVVDLEPEVFSDKMAAAFEASSDAAQMAMAGMEENIDLDAVMQDIPQSEDLLDKENDAPIIRLLNAVFTQAIKQGASDVHVETFEQNVSIRFRIDGVLHDILKPQRVLAPLIVSRIKILAKLDIAEKRIPQDGRISLRIAGRSVDVRVSTMPSSHGERVVLRLLDKQNARLDLVSLGMSEQDLKQMQDLIMHPHGIILVTGPTGSGKTTTLYAALTELNTKTRNILTIEDPIEFDLPGIGQTQVNNKVDMTFAAGLRAILRQDPDVVMIGEIRDVETAEIAVQASLTGHLVFSTLHTNSAVGAITRLRDMGVESFLLSSTIIGVLAQRLVRVLCPECKVPTKLASDQAKMMGVTVKTAPQIYQAKGCEACKGLGYKGRSGIYELVTVDDKLKEMIHQNKSEAMMELHAHTSAMSIQQDGWRQVFAGVTTIEEVLRVTAE